MTTSKCLVAFDPKRPALQPDDYVTPVRDNGEPEFYGINSGGRCRFGMVVSSSRPMSAAEIVERLSASGVIPPEDRMQSRSDIEAYIDMCNQLRVGSIVEVLPSPHCIHGFELLQMDPATDKPRVAVAS